jgi:hypothetical protein
MGWSWRDCVDANVLGDEVLCQNASEGSNGALCRSVVSHGTCSAECNRGCAVDDSEMVSYYSCSNYDGRYVRRALGHVRKGEFCNGKHL